MNRIYHTWEKWECYPAGFYNAKASDYAGARKAALEKEYSRFLSNDEEFAAALKRVTTEWKHSCEHYLSNENMNRIAWLGQAAACIALNIPAGFRGGYHVLTKKQQHHADEVALEALNEWLLANGGTPLTLEEAGSKTEMDLY